LGGDANVLGKVRDRDVDALAGERERIGPADARVAAGNQGPPALEPAAAVIALLAVVGRRDQVGLVAGRSCSSGCSGCGCCAVGSCLVV
jgi:hypothetical protein